MTGLVFSFCLCLRLGVKLYKWRCGESSVKHRCVDICCDNGLLRLHMIML